VTNPSSQFQHLLLYAAAKMGSWRNLQLYTVTKKIHITATPSTTNRLMSICFHTMATLNPGVFAHSASICVDDCVVVGLYKHLMAIIRVHKPVSRPIYTYKYQNSCEVNHSNPTIDATVLYAIIIGALAALWLLLCLGVSAFREFLFPIFLLDFEAPRVSTKFPLAPPQRARTNQ